MALSKEDAMSDSDHLSIDALRLWSDVSLKSFLLVRKKIVDGSHDTLVARAFVAWEEGATVDATHEHKMRANLLDYKRKLTVQSGIVPDPYSLEDWFEEDKSLWPSLSIADISEYLKHTSTHMFYSKIIQEYKLGKGYRYFTSNHVKDVYMHPIGDKYPVLFLSCKVTPSMKTSVPPYQVWSLVQKDSKTVPGGHIHSCYCTCPAGLHGSCNHIAGLLFKVEYHIRNGKVSSTSKPCAWNVPKKEMDAQTKRLDAYTWTKVNYFQGSTMINV